MKSLGRALPSILALSVLCAANARAQDSVPNAASVALFDEGRALMKAGKYPEACAKFEQSVAGMRSVGGLLNLADCYEKLGRTASAWATFRTAAGTARDLQDPRDRVATGRAAALESKLVRLVIVVSPDVDRTSLQVKRDGKVVPAAEWGEAMPVDPATHVVEASAPGKRTWSKDASVLSGSATVTIHALADEAKASETVIAPDAHAGPAKESTVRIVGVALGGVGVGGLLLGSIAGIVAIHNHHVAEGDCVSYPDHCSPSHSADSPNQAAQTWATVSTIGFIAGGALAAAGAILYLTAPKASTSASLTLAPRVGAGSAGVLLTGAF